MHPVLQFVTQMPSMHISPPAGKYKKCRLKRFSIGFTFKTWRTVLVRVGRTFSQVSGCWAPVTRL